MNRTIRSLAVIFVVLLVASSLIGQETPRDKAKYVPKYRDPVLEEMRTGKERANNRQQAQTQKIRDRQERSQAKEEQAEKRIRFDFTGVQKPDSPQAFESVFHFDPIRQFLTGTCWAFSTTSFFESEVYRLSGRKIKLSEMYTVYHEYLEEARRYVQERGDSFFDEGSEGNALMMVWDRYGIVPAGVYKGELDEDGRYDHEDMTPEMISYLGYLKHSDLWDEDLALSSLRLIMDKYMGTPPERFVYEGADMTPSQFLSEVLRLNLDDYVCVMSTLAQPFHAYGEYEVEMNWWHSKDYYNLPLDQFYGVIKYAIENGYSVRLNGDVSEPGYNGFEDAAIIPTFDIPREYIDQDAREFRFNNETTADDHDVHLVGYLRQGDHDWFLIKDSASSAQHGKFEGYYFYREDYIKLKMLTYIVHQDALKAVVSEFR
ncbi:MAG: peptidase C1 [Fidelibacterota bacterium]|nr:MAG: peptidase C1 [Candidatus Neomarinimicrobiota bacterium]